MNEGKYIFENNKTPFKKYKKLLKKKKKII